FAMILLFLAVEGKGAAVAGFRKGHRGGGGQGNALIGGAENDVIIQAAAAECRGVGAAELHQVVTGIEQPGIEKIRAGATGFQGELAKTKDVPADGKFDKIVLIVVHGKVSGGSSSFKSA